MIEIGIKDENLLKIVKMKLFVENIKSIEMIDEISIPNQNFSGKNQNINLAEITKLTNLKSLSLQFFDITDDVIDYLNSLEELEDVQLYMCNFNTEKKIDKRIKSINIYNCRGFKLKCLEELEHLEDLKVIHSGLIDVCKLISFKSLKFLNISNCNIISFTHISELKNLKRLILNRINLEFNLDITEMKKLEFISLNGSKVPNKEEYIQNLKSQNQNVKIEFRDNSYPIK